MEQIKDYIDIISNCAILISVITLLFNLRQTRRINYITCTAKYTKIQELLLANENLAALHLRIYRNRLPAYDELRAKLPEDKRTQSERLSEELALSAMMFQLMEDVWTVDLKRKNRWMISPKNRRKYAAIYEGWDSLFRDWMATPEIREKWEILKSHYNTEFAVYTDHHY